MKTLILSLVVLSLVAAPVWGATPTRIDNVGSGAFGLVEITCAATASGGLDTAYVALWDADWKVATVDTARAVRTGIAHAVADTFGTYPFGESLSSFGTVDYQYELPIVISGTAATASVDSAVVAIALGNDMTTWTAELAAVDLFEGTSLVKQLAAEAPFPYLRLILENDDSEAGSWVFYVSYPRVN